MGGSKENIHQLVVSFCANFEKCAATKLVTANQIVSYDSNSDEKRMAMVELMIA